MKKKRGKDSEKNEKKLSKIRIMQLLKKRRRKRMKIKKRIGWNRTEQTKQHMTRKKLEEDKKVPERKHQNK